MAKHDAQAAAKRARNETYALKFARRDKAAKKAMRHERTQIRERRWLLAAGIEPAAPKPLTAARRRKRRR